MADQLYDQIVSKTVAQFTDKFGTKPDAVSVAPGRVEVLGNHTDYNGGYILSAAIDRRTCIAVKKDVGQTIRIAALDMHDETRGGVGQITQDDRHKWANYPLGVIKEIEELSDAPQIGGASLAIHTEVPLGAGLSSSAALEVATALAMQLIYPFEIDKMALAQLCQRAENGFVGVSSGLMDQFSSVFGKKNSLLFLDCMTLEHDALQIECEKPVSLVVCNSMVKHALTGGEYNSRRAECMSAAKKMGHELLRDATLSELENSKSILTENEYKRAKHIITENERVLLARKAAEEGDVVTLGALMSQSHESSRTSFENSTKELDQLVDIAKSIDGCYGARLTGGGFGGAVLALVDLGKAEQFSAEVARQYGAKINKKPEVFICSISDGASAQRV